MKPETAALKLAISSLSDEALIDYDFDQAIIKPNECMYNREMLFESGNGIHASNNGKIMIFAGGIPQ